MHFPDSIFKIILEYKTSLFQTELETHANTILNFYYNQNTLNSNDYLQTRIELKQLIEKAFLFPVSISVLCQDNDFKKALEQHGGRDRNQKQFAKMNWMDSFITTIWFLKFH